MILCSFVNRLHYPKGVQTLQFQDLFMMAADIDYNAFEAGQPLDKVEQIAKRVQVYYKKDDMALDKSKFWFTLVDRMGEKGPKNKSIKPGVVYSIDINKVNDLQLIELGDSHRYFLTSKMVANDVINVSRNEDLSQLANRETINSTTAMLG